MEAMSAIVEGYAFVVNDYLTLKLEKGKTVIYVNGERFSQCKYLLLNLDKNNLEQYDTIDSIDEAARLSKDLGSRIDGDKFLDVISVDESAERLSNALEGDNSSYNIPPETEFWGHCSNLQAWVEYGYDTRLIHSNLGFPLLKRLTDVGDPTAKSVFKDEIAQRFSSGYVPVIEYLLNGGYFLYLNKPELDCLLEDNEVLAGKIRNLKTLYLSDNQLTVMPESIGELTSLQVLDSGGNHLESLPDSIGDLRSLKNLYLGGNHLESLPDSIGELTSLQVLYLDGNQLTMLPESIERLKAKGLNIYW